MGKHTNAFTLEENLTLTNEELMSNWIKLASLILTYEKNITWDSARAKSRQLLKDGLAVQYIETARKNTDGKPVVEPEIQASTPSSLPKLQPKSSIYHKNFERLLLIAPGLEEKLANIGNNDLSEVYGKSKRIGYMDLNIELIRKDKDSFYMAMSHYKMQNGDMIPDPDMVIRVDLKNNLIEALSFQDYRIYKEVYDDIYHRKMVNPNQQKSQNAFLADWLKNLKKQRHEIVWREPDSTGIADSNLIIEYDKESEGKETEKTKAETPPQPEEEPKQEVMKAKDENVPLQYSDEEVKKLVSAIMYHELYSSIKIADAEKKANKLMENNTTGNYLLEAIENLRSAYTADLMESNYFKLLHIVPDLIASLTSDKISVSLSSNERKQLKGRVSNYEIVFSSDGDKTKRSFVIQEKKASGTLAILVHGQAQYISVQIISGGFADNADYYDASSSQDDDFKANEMFGRWLTYIIDKEYSVGWKGEAIPEPEQSKVEETTEPTAEPLKNDPPVEEKPKADEIPDFEVGKVRLVQAHVKAGITQKHIDWINQHQQGMTITPRRQPMIQNTKDRQMDKLNHAMKPGFRISATGKLYYEGRSNRSDKRKTGL